MIIFHFFLFTDVIIIVFFTVLVYMHGIFMELFMFPTYKKAIVIISNRDAY